MEKLQAICARCPFWLLCGNPDPLVSFHVSIYADPLLKLQMIQTIIDTGETAGNSWCWRKITRVLARPWHWDKVYANVDRREKDIPVGSNISKSCHHTDMCRLSGVLRHRMNTSKACKQLSGQYTAYACINITYTFPHRHYHQHSNILNDWKHYGVV